jgi:hypothetical protein
VETMIVSAETSIAPTRFTSGALITRNNFDSPPQRPLPFHALLTRWRQSHRLARFRPSPSPSSLRARLWPLPGRYVARYVSSGEVVAGPSHSASGARVVYFILLGRASSSAG